MSKLTLIKMTYFFKISTTNEMKTAHETTIDTLRGSLRKSQEEVADLTRELQATRRDILDVENRITYVKRDRVCSISISIISLIINIMTAGFNILNYVYNEHKTFCCRPRFLSRCAIADIIRCFDRTFTNMREATPTSSHM